MITAKIAALLQRKFFNGARIQNQYSPEWVRKNNYTANRKQIRKLRAEWTAYAHDIPPYPGTFSGRGIVVCAGGYTYITCAWVNISMLRKSGCALPVELWHAGGEINASMIRKFEELNVVCRDCNSLTEAPVKGFAIKPFAILHSAFKEVLFLDADNNCVSDPAYLFDSEVYKKTGTIFWPDLWRTHPENPVWQVVAATAYSTPEQESGQLLVNKEQCWRELNLCMYFNNNRQVYYKMLHGDKDTFKFAWMALNTTYYMVPAPPAFGGFVHTDGIFYGLSMIQHDMDNKVLFLHRNLMKWAQTQDGEMLWTHVKKRRNDAARAKFVPREIEFRSGSLDFVDMEGDVELLPFEGVLGKYELECMDILKTLRLGKAYQEFVLDQCLVLTRAGYAENRARLR